MYIGLIDFSSTLSIVAIKNKMRCVSVLDYTDDGNIKTTSILEDSVKKKLQVEGYVNLEYADNSMICELCFCDDISDKVRQIIVQRLKDKKIYYDGYKNCIGKIKLLGIKPNLDFSKFSLIYNDLGVRAFLYDTSIANSEDDIFCSFVFFNELGSDLDDIFYHTLLVAFRNAYKNKKSIKTLNDFSKYQVIYGWSEYSLYLSQYKEYQFRPLNELLSYYIQEMEKNLDNITPSIVKERIKSRQRLICLNKDGLHIFENYTILGWSKITVKLNETIGYPDSLISFKDFKNNFKEDDYDVIFKIKNKDRIKWLKCI